MTEKIEPYGNDVQIEFTVCLLDQDLREAREFLNKNKEATKLPEAVYALLSSVVCAYFYGQKK